MRTLFPSQRGFKATANKVVAKIASKWQKPSGLTAIPGRELHRFLAKLPVEQVSHVQGVAQFIGLCSSLKWSRHLTKSPFLALPATVGSNAAYKIISACTNAVS